MFFCTHSNNNKNMTEQQTSAVATAAKKVNVAMILNRPEVMTKLSGILGSEKTANSFISSVISVSQSPSLKYVDATSVVSAAMVAATLQLPIVPSLGFAYIVPFGKTAQFQIGYKGLIEIAERSGQFKNIIDEVVYEGQLVHKNRFTGEYVFDEDAKTTDKVIGYMARIDLINGFSKTIYWTRDEVEQHAKRFSKTFTNGPWKTDFDAMARKTILKALFNKYAPKSLSMQIAIQADQASVRMKKGFDDYEEVTADAFDFDYVDNGSSAAVATEQKADLSGILDDDMLGQSKAGANEQ